LSFKCVLGTSSGTSSSSSGTSTSTSTSTSNEGSSTTDDSAKTEDKCQNAIDDETKDNCPSSQGQDLSVEQRQLPAQSLQDLKIPALVLAKRYDEFLKIFTPLPSLKFTKAMSDHFFEIGSNPQLSAILPKLLNEIMESSIISIDTEHYFRDDQVKDKPRMVLLGTSRSCKVYLLKSEWISQSEDGKRLPMAIRKAIIGSDCFIAGSEIQKDLDWILLAPNERIIDTGAAYKYLVQNGYMKKSPWVKENSTGIAAQATAVFGTYTANLKTGTKESLLKKFPQRLGYPDSFYADIKQRPSIMYNWGVRSLNKEERKYNQVISERQKLYLAIDAITPILLLAKGLKTFIEADPAPLEGSSETNLLQAFYEEIIGVAPHKLNYDMFKAFSDDEENLHLAYIPKTTTVESTETPMEVEEAIEPLSYAKVAASAPAPAKPESSFVSLGALPKQRELQLQQSTSEETTKTPKKPWTTARPVYIGDDQTAGYRLKKAAICRVNEPAGRTNPLDLINYQCQKLSSNFKSRDKHSLMPHLTGCPSCGGKHKSVEECEVHLNKQICPYCGNPGHTAEVCRILHNVCALCALRGHIQGDCPVPEEWHYYKRHFEEFADLGQKTKLRRTIPEYGMFYFDERHALLSDRLSQHTKR
jgi:hypothetical protein